MTASTRNLAMGKSTTDHNPALDPEEQNPRSAASEPTLRQGILFYVVAVFAYGGLFYYWQAEPVPTGVYLRAILVAATCFVPLALWYARGSKELPMFELISLSYAAQFSMPVFTQRNEIIIRSQLIILPWDDLATALLSVELGVIFLIAGYFMVRGSPLKDHLPKLDLPLDPRRRSLYLIGALCIGGLIKVLQAANFGLLRVGALSAIFELIGGQFNLAVIILATAIYEKRERRPQVAVLLYGMVAFASLMGLATGALEQGMIPLALLLAVRWYATRRLPWKFILVGILLFLILNPAKYEYRRLVWYGGRSYSIGEQLGLWFQLIGESTVNLVSGNSSEEENADDEVSDSLGRLDLVHKFTYVQELTPTVVPFYGGQTYDYFLYFWIPRVIWPNKPSASTWSKRMDVDYGLRYEWQNSSIGIGQLAESYANFGNLGIVFVLFLQGLVFGGLNSVLNGPRSEGGRAIYLAAIVFFLNGIGSTSAILFGALLQIILANAVILRAFSLGFRAPEDELISQDQVSSQHLATSFRRSTIRQKQFPQGGRL